MKCLVIPIRALMVARKLTDSWGMHVYRGSQGRITCERTRDGQVFLLELSYLKSNGFCIKFPCRCQTDENNLQGVISNEYKILL